MDRGLPTSALGLLSRLTVVVLRSPVNEIYGALWNTRPRKRRNSIDNRSEFAERLPNLTRDRFVGFSSAHRATNQDSRTLSHASAELRPSIIDVHRYPAFLSPPMDSQKFLKMP